MQTVDTTKAQETISRFRLPPGTRLHYRQKGVGFLVVEYKPTCRSVVCYAGSYTRYLSFPYMVFVMPYANMWCFGKVVTSLYLGVRNEPLQTIYDRVGLAPLPNYFSSEYRVCMSENHRWYAWGYSVSLLFDTAIRRFWESGYSGDGGAFWPDHNARTFDKWQEGTLRDKDFAMRFNWTANEEWTKPLWQLLPGVASGTKLIPIMEGNKDAAA